MSRRARRLWLLLALAPVIFLGLEAVGLGPGWVRVRVGPASRQGGPNRMLLYRSVTRAAQNSPSPDGRPWQKVLLDGGRGSASWRATVNWTEANGTLTLTGTVTGSVTLASGDEVVVEWAAKGTMKKGVYLTGVQLRSVRLAGEEIDPPGAIAAVIECVNWEADLAAKASRPMPTDPARPLP